MPQVEAKLVNSERLEQIVKLGREILVENPAAHWQIRNQLEVIDRLLPSKSLSIFGTGAVRANAEVGLRNATIRLLELIATA